MIQVFITIVFSIDSKKLVDDVYNIAKSNGATILDEPSDYPLYAKNIGSEKYYAVFFTDFDNIKLEFAWMPKK